MRQGAMSLRMPARRGEVPALVRFLGKLVLEVLPAALASIIGAFLFAHYQFSEPETAGSAAASAQAVPASTGMLQVVREEHAMIRNLLAAEQSAEEKRMAAADAGNAAAAPAVADAQPAAGVDSRAVAEAKPAAATRHILLAQIAGRAEAKRSKPAPTADSAPSDAGSAPTAQLPTVVVAGAPQDPAVPPPPPPAGASFVSRTLAIPGHVVAVTLHAVMAIGGIPSWIGHRVGATELDTEAPHPGAAS